MKQIFDARLESLRAAGVLEAVDVELACALSTLSGHDNADVRLAIALASRAPRDGHTCLTLSDVAADRFAAEDERVRLSVETPWPTADELRTALVSSPLLEATGDDEVAPLVLRGEQLYLQRFDVLEASLALSVLSRMKRRLPALTDDDHMRLKALFPDESETSSGGQRNAAAVALQSSLAVITGGPGTGKTTTILRVLVALLARETADQLPGILLIAPTGKAASRLSESVAKGLALLPPELLDNTRLQAIPRSAETIHRALGVHPERPHRPRHHSGNPLAADIVVVDESSMVDLPLMARLFDAVRPEARLILLGDADQLASVDAGAVLRDLVESQALSFAVSTLRQSRRFSDTSALGELVSALREDDWSGVERALGLHVHASTIAAEAAAENEEVRMLHSSNHERVPREVIDAVRAHTNRLANASSPEAALEELSRFRLLTALRRGSLGSAAINEYMLGQLGGELVAGTPVLVVQNAPNDELANGDLGVVWEESDGRRVVLFSGSHGPRKISLRRLPRHEVAFAMTVHKSQGSEFDHVMVLLPPPPSPILTRELLYTAVSRARRQVTIAGRPAAVAAAHGSRVRRATGLQARLQGTAMA